MNKLVRPPKHKASKHKKKKAITHAVSPLHLAALRGDAPVVGLLCELGAKQTKWKKDGTTPLFAAVMGGHVASGRP